jgi:hypothetical protein
VSSFRAPVERAVATLKTWRILFTDYRRPLKTFKSSFRAAIGLYFFKESFRITLKVTLSLPADPFLGGRLYRARYRCISHLFAMSACCGTDSLVKAERHRPIQ